MKTKKQLTVIILVTCLLVTGIVYGKDPLTGAGKDTASVRYAEGMGWQEQTKRTWVVITDGVRISTGPSACSSGLGWSIRISSNISWIECCHSTTQKESWCNFNADDPKCPE